VLNKKAGKVINKLLANFLFWQDNVALVVLSSSLSQTSVVRKNTQRRLSEYDGVSKPRMPGTALCLLDTELPIL